MYRRLVPGAALVIAMVMAVSAQEKTVTVGGAPMFPSKNIIENAVNSKDHTTLVAAVKAAGLVDTLQGSGPFTVFAPTNAAFDKLPRGTVESLLEPKQGDMLRKVLTYHVVAGRHDAHSLMDKARMGEGTTELITVSGGKLWVTMKDGKLWLRDEMKNIAGITVADVYQSNGVIHVIDTVLMPN